MILALLGIIVMFFGAVKDDKTPPWDDSGTYVFLTGLIILLVSVFITTAK